MISLSHFGTGRSWQCFL